MVVLAGYGVFSSVGGRSSGANGGGSAGRIAIHSSRVIQYQGRYQVFGVTPLMTVTQEGEELFTCKTSGKLVFRIMHFIFYTKM